MACDACRKRKIKCAGGQPCTQCRNSDIICTYDLPVLKKGPKRRRRDTALGQIRAQTQAVIHAGLANSSSGNSSSSSSPTAVYNGTAPLSSSIGHIPTPPPPLTFPPSSTSPLLSNAYAPVYDWTRISPQLVLTLINEFFDANHLQSLFLSKSRMLAAVANPHPSASDYAVTLAISLLTLMSVRSKANADYEWDHDLLRRILAEAIRARCDPVVAEEASEQTVILNLLLFMAYFTRQRPDKGYLYLNSAVAIIRVMGLDNEITYASMHPYTALRRRMLFFDVFVTERGACVMYKMPISLWPTVQPPVLDLTQPDQAQFLVFVYLAKLFEPADLYFDLIGRGPYMRRHKMPISMAELVALTRRLGSLKPLALNLVSEVQRADVLFSVDWFRVLLWQAYAAKAATLAVTPDTVVDPSVYNSIADEVIAMGPRYYNVDLTVHGLGLVTKLSEVLRSLTQDQAIKQTWQHRIMDLNHRYRHRVGDCISALLALMTQIRGYDDVSNTTLIQSSSLFFDAGVADNMDMVLDMLQQYESADTLRADLARLQSSRLEFVGE